MHLIPRNPYPHSFVDLITAIFKQNSEKKILASLLKKTNHKYGFFTKSARNAFYLILTSLLNKNDEIIITAFTCNALVGPIKASGVSPKFSDISKSTLNSEFEHIRPLISKKTKAIIVTHQFGYPVEMEKLSKFCKKKRILLIEDAASAIGAKINGEKIGKFSDIIFFSFEKSKVISCITGGMICFNKKKLLKKFSHLKKSQNNNSFVFIAKSFMQKILYLPTVYPLTYKIFHWWYKAGSNAYSWKENKADYELSYGNLTKFQLNLLSNCTKEIDKIIEVRNLNKKIFYECLKKNQTEILMPQNLNKKIICTNSRIPILINSRNKDRLHSEMLKKKIDLGYTFSYAMPSYFNKNLDHYPNTRFVIKSILNLPVSNFNEINIKIISSLKSYLIKNNAQN
jgi:dTDP-4-amino-4,6-dideoxygalactose transaminase